VALKDTKMMVEFWRFEEDPFSFGNELNSNEKEWLGSLFWWNNSPNKK